MRAKRLILLILITVLFSILLRLFYAYICSFYIYCDTAIMGLIAEQILRGEFPLFFYGGFYAWVIESWFIAAFFFLFGVSNYTIYLGPIFISILFLVSTYYLGREFENKRVGILALIYSAFPPFYFFKYSVIPVGYLAALPLFGNIVFLLTFIVVRNKFSVKMCFYFCLLGLFSAICFWLHPISLYYLLSVALFLFINTIVSKRFGYYICGGIFSLSFFFIGALPCWLFNIRHDFCSFVFSNTVVSSDIIYGIKRFIIYQVPGVLGNNLFTLIVFYIGFFLVTAKIKLKNVLFISLFIFMAILFSQGGSFVASKDFRYIIPMFSLIPVVLAYLAEWINKRSRYLGTGLFIILISINLLSIRNGVLRDANGCRAEGGMYDELMDYFRKNKIDGVYGRLEDVNTISFLGRGRVYAAEVINNANSFDENVMRSNKIAYINRGDFGSNFNVLCKSFKKSNMNRYNVISDFEPLGYYGEEIAPKGWKARSNHSQDWVNWAFDRNLDRYWSSISPKQSGIFYEIEFPEVFNIYKMQVFNMPSEYSYRNLPSGFKLYTSMDGRDWNLVKENTAGGIFWSGPNVLWRQRDTLWEVIFPPVKARFVKIENAESSGHNTPWEINEILFYKYIGERQYRRKDYIYNAKKAYEYLKNRKIKFVYTDYWLSEKIREWSKDDIQSLRIYNNSWTDRPNTSRFINLDEKTAIIVNNENANAVEIILAELEIVFERENINGYACFCFPRDQNKYLLNNIKSLYWINSGICKVNTRAYGRLLMDYAVLLDTAGQKSDAEKYYIKAAKYFYGNPYLRNKLLQMYKDSNSDILYKREKLRIKKRFNPSYKCNIKFDSGIEFLGLDSEQLSNGLYRINYFWRLDKNLDDKIFVFAHFIKDGKIIFQNDHPLLENFVRLPVLLPDEVWKESYIIKTPDLIPSGEYIVKMGLWLPEKGGRRLRILGSKSNSFVVKNVNLSKNKLRKDI